MHLRRKILNDLATLLKGLTGFGAVRIQRVGPPKTIFPAITLYAEEESCQTLTVHPQPRAQDRVLTVSINAWIRGTVDDEKAETDMDAAAVLIESVMSQPTNADDIVLVGTDFNIAEDEPEIHVITLTYHVSYHSTEKAATV